MAEKIKRISVNAFEEAANKTYVPTVTVQWNGLDVVIRQHITLPEMARFVDVCTKACFDPDSGEYAPEAKDLAIRSCIVAFYTNIALPANLAKQYSLIYQSMILDIITTRIDQIQLNSIIRAVDDKVAHLANANITALNKQMDDLYAVVADTEKKFADLFAGISAADIERVTNAIVESKLDEEKLVTAYLEQTKEQDGTAETDNAGTAKEGA